MSDKMDLYNNKVRKSLENRLITFSYRFQLIEYDERLTYRVYWIKSLEKLCVFIVKSVQMAAIQNDSYRKDELPHAFIKAVISLAKQSVVNLPIRLCDTDHSTPSQNSNAINDTFRNFRDILHLVQVCSRTANSHDSRSFRTTHVERNVSTQIVRVKKNYKMPTWMGKSYKYGPIHCCGRHFAVEKSRGNVLQS